MTERTGERACESIRLAGSACRSTVQFSSVLAVFAMSGAAIRPLRAAAAASRRPGAEADFRSSPADVRPLMS